MNSNQQNNPPQNLDNIEKFIENLNFPFSIDNLENKEFLDNLLICLDTKYSFLRELASILPKEAIFNFLYVFSGQKLIVPDSHVLYNTVRDLHIYNQLKDNNNPNEIANLAAKFKMTTQTVLYAYNKIKILLECT